MNSKKALRPTAELFRELCEYTGETFDTELQFGGPAEIEFLDGLQDEERGILKQFLNDRADTIRRAAFEDSRLTYGSFSEVEEYANDTAIPVYERIEFLHSYLAIWRVIGYGKFQQRLSNSELLTVEHHKLNAIQLQLLESRLTDLINNYPVYSREDNAQKEVTAFLTHAAMIPSLTDRLLFLKKARIEFDSRYPGPSRGMAVETHWSPFRRLNAEIDMVETELRLSPASAQSSSGVTQQSKQSSAILLVALSPEPRFDDVRAFLQSLETDDSGRMIWNQVEGDLPLLMFHIRQANGLPYTKETHKYTARCFVWGNGKEIDGKSLARKLGNMDRGNGGRAPGDKVGSLIASLSR